MVHDMLPMGVRRPRADSAMADNLFRWIVTSCGIFVLVALSSVAVSLAWGGAQAFETFGFGFIYGTTWDPVARQFAGLVPIYGTFVSATLAMIVGVPVSLGIAIFVTEVAPRWLRGPVGGTIELLAGIPSIIYGMWGLFTFAPIMSDHVQPFLIDWLGPLPIIGSLFSGAPFGIGMLTAGIVLAIMIVPYISSVMRDVFLVVPAQLKESAYALGSTRWEVIRDIVIPYTRTGVIGGIFLGLGRALGETMAVTFVLGNSNNISISLMEPGNSIAAAIANEFTEADSEIYLSSLIALGFILFVVSVVVLSIAKILLQRISRQKGE